MKYDVITIGSATKDVFLVSKQIELIKSQRFSTGVGECVSLGSKIDVDELFVSSGGGATNAAATFSKLGYKVACITKVGDDSDGRDIKKELNSLDVETKTVITDKAERTGYSTLLTAPSGERTALVFRGVSKSFSVKDIDWDLFEQTRWVYITSLGGNVELTKRIINTCRKNGVHIAWNPGMNEIEESPDVILSMLKKDVHVFNVNREEAARLTGEPQEHILKLFSKMSPDDNQIRIITDGINGAYLCNGSSCYKSGTTQVKNVSRTGAGDAFGSGVVASLMRGDAIHMALKIGTMNAQSVIKSLGAKQGIITKFPTAKQLSSIPIETL
jgi:sugar/nucleoside kinase (ribokinase family)